MTDSRQTWHLPISRALGFDLDSNHRNWRCRWSRVLRDGTAESQLEGSSVGLEISDDNGWAARFCLENGVIDRIEVNHPFSRPSFNLYQVLSLQPVQSLVFSLGAMDVSNFWQTQSSNLLSQIRRLTLCLDEEALEHAGSIASQIIEDQHLCNVRNLNILAGGFGLDTIGDSVLRAIRNSNFIHNLESLSLSSIDPPGLIRLCENSDYAWSELFLDGGIGHDGPKAMMDTGLPNHLETLMIRSIGWDDELRIGDTGLRTFCQHLWPKLRRFDLSGQGLSSDSLDCLSESPFITQLEYLDLSDNKSLLSHPADLHSLEKLAGVLAPSRLKALDLTNTGLARLPSNLEDRLGNRVRI